MIRRTGSTKQISKNYSSSLYYLGRDMFQSFRIDNLICVEFMDEAINGLC